MIDKFYDKLDKLKVENIEQALTDIQKHVSKDKFYEVKYKIPTRWTKKFNLDDIVPYRDKLLPPIMEECG